MNEEKNITINCMKNNETKLTGVTSPLAPGNLVSKVNSLTSNNRVKQILNPQSASFSTDKGITLDYKQIIDELIKITPITNLNDFYSKLTV